jgi:alanine racemase
LPPLPRTAWAEIDLDALTANLATLRSLAGPATALQAVVKADAYGHGVGPVARALARAGVDGFCVATFDEGVALREMGIREPVLVLYPVPPEVAGDAADLRLAICAGDAGLLDELASSLAARPADRPSLEVQLEIETGLGRGGFAADALSAAATKVAETSGLRLGGAWTHLQAADDLERTSRQVARFEEAVRRLRALGFELPALHLAASGGLLLGSAVSLQGARPGLALYGLLPDELLVPASPRPLPGAESLRPVLELLACPVRVLDLPAGWGVSYGPSFTTSRPSRIATLPLGYGDGWSRALSNRAEALVRGVRVPLVGTVAMDAVMADVSDVPGPPVGVHDEFVLLGSQGHERITAADLAAARGTISWEVVTNLAGRLPRVYHASSEPQEIRTLVPGALPVMRSS